MHHTPVPPHKVCCAMCQASGLGGNSLVLWQVPKHKAEARAGEVCINTSQMVLKSLRSIDVWLSLGEALVETRSLKV